MDGRDLELRILEPGDHCRQHCITNEAEMGREFESVRTFQVLAVVVLATDESHFVQDAARLGLKQRAVWTVAQQQGPADTSAVTSPDGSAAYRLHTGQRLHPLIPADGLNHFLEQG